MNLIHLGNTTKFFLCEVYVKKLTILIKINLKNTFKKMFLCLLNKIKRDI